jgi:hypothetical protein
VREARSNQVSRVARGRDDTEDGTRNAARVDGLGHGREGALGDALGVHAASNK